LARPSGGTKKQAALLKTTGRFSYSLTCPSFDDGQVGLLPLKSG